jgi:hypothetical protein
LALRTWVSGPGSLVAGGHGLCGRFRHRKRSRNVIGRTDGVPPQKTLPVTDSRLGATCQAVAEPAKAAELLTDRLSDIILVITMI